MIDLHASVAARSASEVLYLLQNGSNVDAADPVSGKTALHMAVEFGEYNIASILLAAGAAVNAVCTTYVYTTLRTVSGLTPLHLAAAYGHHTITELLISAGADLEATSESEYHHDYRALHYAAEASSVLVLKKLLEAGADTEAMCTGIIQPGKTALHLAIICGSLEITRSLIDAGANVNAQEGEGSPPLALAAAWKNARSPIPWVNTSPYDDTRKEMLELLIHSGATIDGVDGYRVTSLMYAAGESNLDAMLALLANGATVTAADNNGDTALHRAVKCGRYSATKLLLEHGASATLASASRNQTPLHALGLNAPYFQIGGFDSDEIARTCALMVSHGADVSARDINGQTLLDTVAAFAASWGVGSLLVNAVEALLTAAITLDNFEVIGRRALHKAITEYIRTSRVQSPFNFEHQKQREKVIMLLYNAIAARSVFGPRQEVELWYTSTYFTPLSLINSLGANEMNPERWKLHIAPSIVSLVVAGEREWACVPSPCPGIGRALLPVWEDSPLCIAEVIARLEEEVKERLHVGLFVLQRYLPVPGHQALRMQIILNALA